MLFSGACRCFTERRLSTVTSNRYWFYHVGKNWHLFQWYVTLESVTLSIKPDLCRFNLIMLQKNSPKKSGDCALSSGLSLKSHLLISFLLFLQNANRKTSFCLREVQETSRSLTLGQAVMNNKGVSRSFRWVSSVTVQLNVDFTATSCHFTSGSLFKKVFRFKSIQFTLGDELSLSPLTYWVGH